MWVYSRKNTGKIRRSIVTSFHFTSFFIMFRFMFRDLFFIVCGILPATLMIQPVINYFDWMWYVSNVILYWSFSPEILYGIDYWNGAVTLILISMIALKIFALWIIGFYIYACKRSFSAGSHWLSFFVPRYQFQQDSWFHPFKRGRSQ